MEDTLSLADSDDELLDELDKDLHDDEDTGGQLASRLAKTIGKRFTTKVSEKKLEPYKRPSNCTELQVQKVNHEVWDALPSSART